MTFPPVFYINLERRKDRRQFQERQAALHRLRVERVEAIDGTKASLEELPGSLSAGAEGLWLTFVGLVEWLAKDGVEAAVILEDDAVLVPRFRKRIQNLLDQDLDSVALVQLGYIGKSAWRSNYSTLRNIKKILRPRSRYREVMAALRTPAERGVFASNLGAGTHCLLVFPTRMLAELPMIDRTQPLDRALVLHAATAKGRFLRSRKNLAYQLPFESDIPWTKFRTPTELPLTRQPDE